MSTTSRVTLAVLLLTLALGGTWYALHEGLGRSAGDVIAHEPTPRPEPMELPERAGARSTEASRVTGAGVAAAELPRPPARQVEVLEPEAATMRRITGRLLRAADGTPYEVITTFLAGALSESGEVLIPGAPAMTLVTTDERGEFDALVPAETQVLFFATPTTTIGYRTGGIRWLHSAPRSPGQSEAAFEIQFARDLSSEETPEHHLLPPGAGDALDLDVRISTGWILEGRVTDTAGVPRPDALVVLDEGFVAFTDAAGRYRIVDIPHAVKDTQWSCIARAEGHVAALQDVLLPARDEVVGPVDFVLDAAGAVEGRITDPQGVPVAHAEVSLLGQQDGLFEDRTVFEDTTRSDTLGQYHLGGVPPGTVLMVAATDGGAPHWIPGVHVAAHETTRLDIVLDSGHSVTGRVLDLDGRPVEGAELVLERSVRWDVGEDMRWDAVVRGPDGGWTRPSHAVAMHDGSWKRERRAEEARGPTGADGRFALSGVTPGDKRLYVAQAPGPHLVPGAQWLTVPAGVASADPYIEIRLFPGATLHGTVRDGAGRPLEQAYLEAWPSSGRRAELPVDLEVFTDRNGEYTLSGLPDGELWVSVSSEGYAGWDGTLTPDGSPLDVVLREADRLHLVVLDDATGDPIRNYDLVVNSEDSSQLFSVDAPDGTHERALAGRDPRMVSVTATGYQRTQVEDVEVQRLSADNPLVVRMKRD